MIEYSVGNYSSTGKLACLGGIILPGTMKGLGDHSYKGVECIPKEMPRAHCKIACGLGYYPNEQEMMNFVVTDGCLSCHEACSKCSGPNPSDCDPESCILPNWIWEDGMCKFTCEGGKYWSNDSEDCEPCGDANCKDCYDGASCMGCNRSYRNFYSLLPPTMAKTTLIDPLLVWAD
jgi:hypothetical protein